LATFSGLFLVTLLVGPVAAALWLALDLALAAVVLLVARPTSENPL